MKSLNLMLTIALCMATLTPVSADVTKFEGVEMGKHLHGPEMSYEEVKGRVVFVVQWNVIDTLCRQALTAAQRSFAKFESQGFVVIASQTKPDSDARAVAWCKKNRITFPVRGRLRLSGDKSYNVPRCWLFNWKGEVVSTGRPETVLQEVGALVKKAPHWLLAGRNFTSPAVKKLIPKLKQGRAFGKLIAELDKAATGGPEAAADATFLKDRLVGLGGAKLSRAEKAVKTDPLKALSQFVAIKGLFKGHEISEKATKRLKELKKDKSFQSNCKAYKALASFEKMASKLNFEQPKEHPSNAKTLANLHGFVRKMKKKFPDSPATAEAEKFLKKAKFKKAKVKK